MLAAFLDRYRETVIWKVSRLGEEQANRRLVPSMTTLLGIVKHLAWVERWWFRMVFAGEAIPEPWTDEDPDPDFRIEPGETIESIVSFYRDEIARSRAISAAAQLDDVAKKPGRTVTLRWIMIHLIEETARHAGHADILRELTDGSIGE